MKENNYILINANIIDVEGGGKFKGSLEIEGHFIKRIYFADETLPFMRKIDMEGKYIIPGLLDMHCHIQEKFAPQFVASGVTTVRNAAGNIMQISGLIEASEQAPTPRVYSADRMIDGHPGLWGPTSFGNLVTDDPEEAKREVVRQVRAGAKFIKVYGLLKKEVMAAVVEEAKKYSLEVSCDLIHSKEVSALDAAELGVTWFEHASGFAQALYPGWYPTTHQPHWKLIDWKRPDYEEIREICKQMVKFNVKLCPTLVINDQIDKYPEFWTPKNEVVKSLEEKDGLAEHWRRLSKESDTLKEQIGFLNHFNKVVTKTFFDLGGTVVAGTDTPALIWTFPGMALHRELEIFVEIGFTEMEALKTATIHAAKSIGLDHLGTIAEGKIADLVILNKNPLENIKHTKEINLIIKGGKLYTSSEILEHIPDSEYLRNRYREFEGKFKATMENG